MTSLPTDGLTPIADDIGRGRRTIADECEGK